MVPDGAAPGYYGVYPAQVTALVDPDKLGRIEVRFPWLGTDGDHDVRAWATLCSPYADNDQGLEILPEVGSQVVVAFEAGNPRRPYILGAAWNGRAKLPATPATANDIRVLRTRSGSRLEFDDGPAPKVSVTMASGHRVVLDDGAQSITIQHAGGCVVTLTATNVDIRANAVVHVTASAAVTVDAPISVFNGIVKCQTLIADVGVMSPSYTPGVGNLL
ncbi:phage baseplate assembly protein V [Longispora sp. K20-0274]|uniref:phage baseplate assembly protein V n=1 Tax=Longispora sp. K20-0274 TaxID=3088255 RepID=UPI00399BE11C